MFIKQEIKQRIKLKFKKVLTFHVTLRDFVVNGNAFICFGLSFGTVRENRKKKLI